MKTEQRRVEGCPDAVHVSTSHAERASLTIRMGSRRFTRLTNAFSKKTENHAHSVAIRTMHYNFVRVHQTPRCTPAMAATTKLCEPPDMVKVLKDWEARQDQWSGPPTDQPEPEQPGQEQGDGSRFWDRRLRKGDAPRTLCCLQYYTSRQYR